MSIGRKKKVLLFIVLPSILALAVVASLLIWVNGVKYSVWVVLLCWAFAILLISSIFLYHTRIIKECIEEEKVDVNPSDQILEEEKDSDNNPKIDNKEDYDKVLEN